MWKWKKKELNNMIVVYRNYEWIHDGKLKKNKNNWIFDVLLEKYKKKKNVKCGNKKKVEK